MTDSEIKSSNEWKTPNEILRLQRLKKKQKALQARLDGPPQNLTNSLDSQTDANKTNKIETKRRNPFAGIQNASKKFKLNENDDSILTSEDSIFNFISNQERQDIETNKSTTSSKHFYSASTASTSGSSKKTLDFSNLTNSINAPITKSTNEQDDEEIYQKPTNYLPIDWSLKTRIRILSKTPLPGNCLKTNQEASGITSFVRCINPKNTTSTNLDTSFGSQLHQCTLYWQHPHLPWLTLFPRSAKSNAGFIIGEKERISLAKEWADSFRSIYKLLRARQCPYFYVCSNTFTVLFRAAGVGSHAEIHAFLTPTSRGMRAALKQSTIEFTMPLKKYSENQNKSLESLTTATNSEVYSTSFSNSSEGLLNDDDSKNNSFNDINDSNKKIKNDCVENKDDNIDDDDDDDDDDDEDHEKWLSSLGVDASEIKKIRSVDIKQLRKIECEEDFSDQSTILIEGVECQAFFNFLLNAKSTTIKVGRLGGVPPTILAPVAFTGSTMRNLEVRFSKVRLDNVDYHSMELKGCILPHILEYLCNLLKETKDTFSATITSHPNTRSFTKAAYCLIENLLANNTINQSADFVFCRANLTDCGLSEYIIEALCRVSADCVYNLERMCYSKEQGGFTWR